MAIDMVSGYSTSSPTQLTQLCLHFLGVPPYVNCQAMYRLKHGLSAILAIMSHYRPVWHERSHALTQGGPVNITCVQYLLIQQFYALHFAIHLVLPVVCDRESFLVVCECRDSDQS